MTRSRVQETVVWRSVGLASGRRRAFELALMGFSVGSALLAGNSLSGCAPQVPSERALGGAPGGGRTEQPTHSDDGDQGGAGGEGGVRAAAGALSEPECIHGSFGDSIACAAWTTCVAGEYVDTEGNSREDRVCAVCPVDTYSRKINASECEELSACQPGEYIKMEGNLTQDQKCQACAPGTYSTDENSDSCQPCPDGSYSAVAGAKSCDLWTKCQFSEGVKEVGSATEDSTCKVESASRQFGTALSEAAIAVVMDTEGNIYVAGQTSGILGQERFGRDDVFVRKYDRTGTEIWTTQLGTDQSEWLKGIALDSEGNVYVTGFTLGLLPGQKGAGSTDAFLVKLEPEGSVAWMRQFGGTEAEAANAIAISPEDEIFIVGETRGDMGGETSSGGSDAFVTKFDTQGMCQWTVLVGTEGDEAGTAVGVLPEGSLYVAGTVTGELVEGLVFGGQDMFVRRLGPDLEVQWTSQFGSSGDDVLADLAVDGEDNALVTGSVARYLPGQANAGGRDWFLRKYSAGSGDIKRTVQRGSSEEDNALSVAVLGNGSVVVSGWTDGILADEEALGGRDGFVSVWSSDLKTETLLRQLGTDQADMLLGLAPTGESSVFVVGSTGGQLPAQQGGGGSDAFLSLVETN